MRRERSDRHRTRCRGLISVRADGPACPHLATDHYLRPRGREPPRAGWPVFVLTSARRCTYTHCRYMATSTQIARWGNSLGLRLPRAVAAEARLGEGDTVEVSVKGGAIVVRPTRPTYSLADLVAKITPRNRHRECDWGPPAGDESW